jgi:hypothetical protein
MAKLNPRAVSAIRDFRRRHPARHGPKSGAATFLARWFGVSLATISSICAGSRWSHFQEPFHGPSL